MKDKMQKWLAKRDTSTDAAVTSQVRGPYIGP